MSARVQRVQGLRSSGAAGPHSSRPVRAVELDEALDYEDQAEGQLEHDHEGEE